jgi:hypothetical protein
MASSIERYANAATTTLSGAITSGSLTLAVDHTPDGLGFPQYRVEIESEYLLVTGVTGTTWTVQRAIERSVAAAHASGTAVVHILTASGLIGVCGSTNLRGDYSTLPAAGVVGRLFQVTSGHFYLRDNGTTWDPVGPIFPLSLPPLASTWTPVNSGSATYGNVGNTLFMEIPSGAGDNVRGLVRPLNPTSGYTITALFTPYWSGETFARIGMGLYDGTKLITHWWDSGSSTTLLSLVVSEWNSVTSFSTGITTGQDIYDIRSCAWGVDMPTWFRIRDDGATLYFTVSKDYQKWYTVGTLGRTAFMTATHAGIFLEGFGSSKKNGISLLSWSEG